MNNLLAYLKPGLEQVEAFIAAALRSDIELLDSTNRSLREHPGKMMRPTLALLGGLRFFYYTGVLVLLYCLLFFTLEMF